MAEPTIAICLDCDAPRRLDQFARCEVCGSRSVFVPGAARETFRRIVDAHPGFKYPEGWRL